MHKRRKKSLIEAARALALIKDNETGGLKALAAKYRIYKLQRA
jgi:hypothetical protein